MHISVVLVAIISAACLVSACGFVPPAPPKPSDAHRIAINRSDPRLYGQEVVTAAPAPTVVPMPIPLAGPTHQTEAPEATPAPSAVTPISVPPAPELVQKQTSDALTTPLASAAQPIAPSPAAQFAPATVTAPAPVQTVETTAATQPPEDIPPAEPPVIKRNWYISPSDGTVRQALTRWAAAENWTFGPDQWELNFDLPIQAQAEFEAESFQQATQALSQAIAMTESPVRPCFYANRVLRVIPFTRSCNRAPAATPAP